MPNGNNEVFQIQERLLTERIGRLQGDIEFRGGEIARTTEQRLAQRGLRGRFVSGRVETRTREGLRGFREALATTQGQLELLRARQAELDEARKEAEGLPTPIGARGFRDVSPRAFGRGRFGIAPTGPSVFLSKTSGGRFLLESPTGGAGVERQVFGSLMELQNFLRRNPEVAQTLATSGVGLGGIGTSLGGLTPEDLRSLSRTIRRDIPVITRRERRAFFGRRAVVGGLATVERRGVRGGERPPEEQPIAPEEQELRRATTQPGKFRIASLSPNTRARFVEAQVSQLREGAARGDDVATVAFDFVKTALATGNAGEVIEFLIREGLINA